MHVVYRLFPRIAEIEKMVNWKLKKWLTGPDAFAALFPLPMCGHISCGLVPAILSVQLTHLVKLSLTQELHPLIMALRKSASAVSQIIQHTSEVLGVPVYEDSSLHS